MCCIGCRSELYKKRPPSPNLELGRQKGGKGRLGLPHTEKTKKKMAKSRKKWCKENPDKVKEAGKKNRGENHYKWKGGITNLNRSIRTMHENRMWVKAVKMVDEGKCRFCGSKEELEVDHITPLAYLLKVFKITNREEARGCAELWDITNGVTLCRRCHCKKDNRKYTKNGYGRRKNI